MHIYYLQHVPYETPGTITRWAEEQGHQIIGTHFYRADILPGAHSIDALVVMGGPMGVHDEKDYPWLIREKEFIRECIRQHKKVLGICLGAQLIADVLNADVAPMTQKEIGWFPLEWTDSARKHPLFESLPRQQTVLHWHGDRFEIPEGALPLAASNGCDNQGFLLDDHVLALQFHLEMTCDGLTALIENSTDELAQAKGPFIQNTDTMLNEGFFEKNRRTIHQLLDRFLTNS